MRSTPKYDAGEFHLKIPSSEKNILSSSPSKISLRIEQGTIHMHIFFGKKYFTLLRNDSIERICWIQHLLKEEIPFFLDLWGMEFLMVPEGDHHFVSDK